MEMLGQCSLISLARSTQSSKREGSMVILTWVRILPLKNAATSRKRLRETNSMWWERTTLLKWSTTNSHHLIGRLPFEISPAEPPSPPISFSKEDKAGYKVGSPPVNWTWNVLAWRRTCSDNILMNREAAAASNQGRLPL